MIEADVEELRDLLKKNLEVAEETHHIVRSMRNAARWGRFFTLVWWIIIIAVSGATYYYYLRPYVDQAEKLYAEFGVTNQQAQDYGKQIADFFNQFKQTH